MLTKIKIKEHKGYYFSYDPEDSSVPVTVHSNWRKTGKTPAVIDETHSRPLKTADDRPRLYVTIATMGKKERVYLDTLVASYLVKNPFNDPQVVNIDGDRYNCHPSNLKWVNDYEYKEYYRNINVVKGKTKQFRVTYKDGTTEVITGFLDFIAKRNVPEHVLYALRKGEIKEYNGIIGFDEVDSETKFKAEVKGPFKFDATGYEVVELDEWPGYYLVYKKEDPTEQVRILSKWKKVGDKMVISEDFTRETSQHIHQTGYYQLNMKRPGEKKIVQKVHRLIAKQLVHNPRPDLYDTVDHIDNNKRNNHPSNLQWTTSPENTRKAANDGLFSFKKFKLTFNDGRVEIVENLKEYCQVNGYSRSECYAVMNNAKSSHKDIVEVTKLRQ